MSDGQYSSPPVGKVSRLKSSMRDANDLVYTAVEQGQDVVDVEEGYDQTEQPESKTP